MLTVAVTALKNIYNGFMVSSVLSNTVLFSVWCSYAGNSCSGFALAIVRALVAKL